MQPIDSSPYAATCLQKESKHRLSVLLLKYPGYGGLKKEKKVQQIFRFADAAFIYSQEKFSLGSLDKAILEGIHAYMFLEPSLNAEAHGHGYDGKSGILLKCSLQKGKYLGVMVSQLGNGLDIEKRHQASRPKKGGIEEMMAFCDRVWWEKEGTCIFLRKYIGERYK